MVDICNNKTEKEFRDNQNNFGHLEKPSDLISWLKSTYCVHCLKQIRYKSIAEKFLDDSIPNKKVLEIGSGVGDFIVFCSSLFPKNIYFANDLSEQLLSGNIDKVLKYFEVDKKPELSFDPVENLNYPDNNFDLVFVKAAVHHFENPMLGLSEICRVLKPAGRLIFFEDPACLNIPIYRNLVKRFFCLNERKLGINENIYTVADYYNFGRNFSDKSFYLDEELVKEFNSQQKKRRGLKKKAGYFMIKYPNFFIAYMIWRFTSPLVFIFTK